MTKSKWFSIAFILSACSIIYELMLASLLSELTGSHVWWYSWTISLFIAGLGVGSYQAQNTKISLIKIEGLLSVIGITAPFLIMYLYNYLYSLDTSNQVLFNFHEYLKINEIIKYCFFAGSQILVFLIGYLSGFEIPLIINQIEKENIKEAENRVLGYNYFGTLLGTIVFTFLFHKNLTIMQTGLIVGFINFVIVLWIMKMNKIYKTILFIIFLLCLLPLNFLNKDLETSKKNLQYFLKEYLFKTDNSINSFLLQNHPPILSIKTLYQNIDIIKYEENAKEKVKMYLDGHYQFFTETEKMYHEPFAHLPILFTNKIPKKVLVLGAGDGMLIRELLKYDEIESIDHIELDATVYELFKNEYSHLNSFAFNNPKVKTSIGDGFLFARNTKLKFDAIYIDFPYPNNYDLARLYSIEFYKNINRILDTDGFIMLDAPLVSIQGIGGRKDLDAISSDSMKTNNVLTSTLFYSNFEYLKPISIKDETFIFAQKHDIKKVKFDNFNLIKSSVINKELIDEMEKDYVPYSINKKDINSLFFPKLLDKWSLSPTL